MRSPADFTQALKSGTVAAGITERFVAGSLDLSAARLTMFWLDPAVFPHFRMALGLWKGDQTLKRAVENALERLDRSGVQDTLEEKYGLDQSVISASP